MRNVSTFNLWLQKLIHVLSDRQEENIATICVREMFWEKKIHQNTEDTKQLTFKLRK